MRRLLLCATLCLAASAHASWVPQFDTNWVTMRVGEKQTIGVRANRLGFAQFPFAPIAFKAANPRVANVTGSLTSTTETDPVVIEAKKPGMTTIVSPRGPTGDLVYIVVGDATPPRIAASASTVAPGEKVLLTVLFPFPEWASIEWFEGPTPERLRSIGFGDDMTVRPKKPGTYRYWASISTPWGISTASIDIDVVLPRRRSVRH